MARVTRAVIIGCVAVLALAAVCQASADIIRCTSDGDCPEKFPVCHDHYDTGDFVCSGCLHDPSVCKGTTPICGPGGQECVACTGLPASVCLSGICNADGTCDGPADPQTERAERAGKREL